MKHYLLHVWTPAEGTPPAMDEMAQIMADLEVINDDLRAQGKWVFSGGLTGPESSTRVAAQGRHGDVLTTDGPFVEGKEYLGGISLIKADDLDDALGFARRITQATGLPIEVRAFHEQ